MNRGHFATALLLLGLFLKIASYYAAATNEVSIFPVLLVSVLGFVAWLVGCFTLASHLGLNPGWGLAGMLGILGLIAILWASHNAPRWERRRQQRSHESRQKPRHFDPTSPY